MINRIFQIVVYLLLAFAFAMICTSCSILKKSSKTEQRKIDSVAVKTFDSLATHFKDSVGRKEIIETDESSIEIEYEDSVNHVDTLKVPINGDDYFYIPVKSKVKKVTIRQKSTDIKKDSSRVITTDLTKVVKTDSVKVVKEEYKKETTKARCSFQWWWIVVLLGVGYLINLRFKFL